MRHIASQKESFWLRVARLPRWAAGATALTVSLLAIAARFALDPVWGARLPFIFFFPAIMLSALAGGFWFGIAATVLCGGASAYFWLPPIHSFAIAGPGGGAALVVFLLVGGAMSAMTAGWRRAQERLRLSEERFRLAIDAAPAAVVLVDARGIILVANDLAERLLGWTREELVGQPVDRLVPAHLRRAHESHRGSFFRNSERRAMGAGRELHALRKDGTEVPVEIGLAPFSTGSEAVVMVAITDVTERRRSAELLDAALRAREEFLAAASHELRGPVSAMRLNLEMVSRMLPADAVARPFLEKADRQTQRLAHLLTNLLDESRLSSGKLVLHPETGDFREIVRSAVDRVADEHRGFAPALLLPAGPVSGRWDPGRAGQIVENLLSNAVKYGNDRPVTVTLDVRDCSAVLAVSDEGDGIAAEDRDRIFRRFERAGAGHRQGFGLGLWISRQFAEAMGGTISVDSVPGAGSTFTLVLPLGTPESSAPPG